MIIEPCRIELFGGLTARHQGRVLTHFATRKCAALLAYLALNPERLHSREELTDLFWPEAEMESARHSFRQALFSLRRHLEPAPILAGSILIVDRNHVRLRPEAVHIDVSEFQRLKQAVEQTRGPEKRLALLTEMTALYRGDALPGMYEDWALAARDRLSIACQEALEQQATEYERVADWGRAIECLQRAVEVGPLHEATHVRLMRLHIANGRPERARRQFQTLSALLHTEGQTTPSAEACALLKSLSSLTLESALQLPPVLRPLPSASFELLQMPSPHLPRPLTRFFGRERELEQLYALLSTSSRCLVTLLGAGGSGKTRLATETGHRLAPFFQNAVYFVSLAELTDTDAISGAIVNALGLAAAPSLLPLAQIRDALAGIPCLLILDNAEHLLPHAASFIADLLDQVPTLSCLVTSRQRLQIAGERVFHALPLPLPEIASPDLRFALVDADVSSCPSVALFVDRAQSARADFVITPRNRKAVLTLCRRLEGIPLSIELAAARIGVLTPQQMLAQLQNRFQLLVNKQRNVTPRHQSLRATVEWSYALLTQAQQSALAAMCVFRGSWTLEAAQDLFPHLPMLDLLQQLRENSLLLAQEQGEAVRFSMLETIREYMLECLSREESDFLAARHADYFARLLQDAQTQREDTQTRGWLDCLEAEHDNLLAALAWKHAHADVGAYLTMVLQMWSFWYTRGHFGEARTRLNSALSRDAAQEPLLRARALNSAATLAWYQGDYPLAHIWLNEALALNRQGGFSPGIVNTLVNQSLVWRDQSEFGAARACAEEALALSRRTQNEHAVIYALFSLGSIALLQTDFAAAQTLLQECVTLRRQCNDLWGLGHTLNLMGELADALHLTEQSEACFQESLGIFTLFGDKQGLSGARHGLGKVALHCGDWNTARGHLRVSLRLRHETGNCAGVIACFIGFEALACGLRQWEKAAHLLGWVEAQDSLALYPGDDALRDRNAEVASAALGAEAYTAAFQQGRDLTGEQTLRLAENL